MTDINRSVFIRQLTPFWPLGTQQFRAAFPRPLSSAQQPPINSLSSRWPLFPPSPGGQTGCRGSNSFMVLSGLACPFSELAEVLRASGEVARWRFCASSPTAVGVSFCVWGAVCVIKRCQTLLGFEGKRGAAAACKQWANCCQWLPHRRRGSSSLSRTAYEVQGLRRSIVGIRPPVAGVHNGQELARTRRRTAKATRHMVITCAEFSAKNAYFVELVDGWPRFFRLIIRPRVGNVKAGI